MTTETASPVEGMSSVDLPADAPESFNSVSEAAAYLSELQEKRKEQPAERANTAAADRSRADYLDDELAKANTEPAEEQPIGEDPEAPEPEEALPPIEPPRSWTKEEKEAFSKLPRDMQEINSRIASARETEFRRSQNEIAEQRKAAEAEIAQARETTKALASKLPEIDAAVQEFLSNKYPDIRSMDDVVKMAHEAERLSESDPFTSLQLGNRLKAWEIDQQRIAKVRNDAAEAGRAMAAEDQSNWAKHVQEENVKAAEFIPDLADKAKSEALTKRVATELLPELGFKDSELADLANGRSKLSIFDYRVQRLLADAVKLRDIQKAPKAIAAKPLPPVQKPGTSRPAGSDASERIQALNRKPELTMKEAEELYSLQTARRAS